MGGDTLILRRVTSKIILINFSWLTYLQQPGNEKATLHLTE